MRYAVTFTQVQLSFQEVALKHLGKERWEELYYPELAGIYHNQVALTLDIPRDVNDVRYYLKSSPHSFWESFSDGKILCTGDAFNEMVDRLFIIKLI